jgi:hypothetical protein
MEIALPVFGRAEFPAVIFRPALDCEGGGRVEASKTREQLTVASLVWGAADGMVPIWDATPLPKKP